MGFTRYFTLKDKGLLTDNDVSNIKQIKKIIEDNSNIKLCGKDGYNEHIITNSLICVNGSASDFLECEPLIIDFTKSNYKDFVKTREYPYDIFVFCILDYLKSKDYLTYYSDDDSVNLFELNLIKHFINDWS